MSLAYFIYLAGVLLIITGFIKLVKSDNNTSERAAKEMFGLMIAGVIIIVLAQLFK